MIIFSIQGNPIPWAAPSFSRGKTYDIKYNEKISIIWDLKAQMPFIWSFPISCACRIEMYFEMPIPNYWTKKKRSQFEIDSKDDKKIWHIKKPDVTNMRKLYEDCLEKAGILSNDSVIVCGETQKYYSSTPRTIIIIKKMESL